MSIDVNVQNDLVIVTESSEDITVNVSNAPGADGVGVPTGGTTGQVLKKLSNTNYDTYWALDGGGVPYSGASGSVNLGPYDLTVNELTIGKGLNGVANNTALGKRTLFHNTTGNYNTAVGHEAGHNLTTGQYNTAIGQSAMFTATTAGQNTAIGVNALLLTTSGGSNVAVGLDTLQHITTGSSNTAIGYNAGSHITGGSTPNTTATNSVFIGRDSKAAADGQTNQIVIGQNAVGNGSNTATFGNTATTANYFTGSINGGSFVKSGGTSSQFLKADGSVDSSTYVGGSGASGQVAYWNGTSSQTGSNNLFWDAANARLGIGTNAPAQKLSVNGNISFGLYGLLIENSGLQITQAAFYDITFKTNNTTRATIFAGGNFQIGSPTSDGGQRLQVYGDAFIKGSGNTNATIGLNVQNSDSTPMLQLLNNGYLRLGSQNTSSIRIYPTDTTGDVELSGLSLVFNSRITTQETVANIGMVMINGLNGSSTSGAQVVFLVSKGFAPTSGTGTYVNTQIQPTINQTGGANGITRGLYVAPTLTAAADWRSIEWSNNSGWGLYGAGTANNYLAGRLGIGQLPVARRLEILQPLGGNAAMIGLYASGGDFMAAIGAQVTTNNLQFAATAGICFYSGSTIGSVATEPTNERMRLTTAGRLLLGTTSESTFLLDVNGTARVSGFTSINNASYNNGAFAVDPLSGQARVAKLGSLEIITTGSPSSTGVGIAVAAANRTLKFYGVAGSVINASDNSRVEFLSQDGVGWTRTSGICRNVLISDFNFSPTSGTATYFGLEVQAIINQTGGANGITRGLYINSTITAAADWRAIEVSAGVSVLAPSTTASATLRIPSGTAPTSPVNGDIWFDGTDLKMRIGGVTKTFTLV